MGVLPKAAEKAGAAGADVAESRSQKYTGTCVCGAVSYTAKALSPLWYCHCWQCRHMTGHFMAASQVKLSDLEIAGEPKWYYVSEKSRHGFCADCGSQMFWRNDDNDYLSVTGGSIEDTKELVVQGHVFTKEKAHYYTLPETEIQFPRYWYEKGNT